MIFLLEYCRMFWERNALLHNEASFAYSKTFDNNLENVFFKIEMHEGLLLANCFTTLQVGDKSRRYHDNMM